MTSLERWEKRTINEYDEPVSAYYRRLDGAEVWENQDEYWAKPWLSGHRRWSATVDGRVLTFHHRRTRRHGGKLSPFGTTRRWKTPENAMRAIDRMYPVKERKS